MNSLTTRNKMFDDFFRNMDTGFFVKPLHGDALPSPANIKMDVKETDKDFTLVAEMPGVSKDDIHVSVDGHVVTLSAEVKQVDAQAKDDERTLRCERYFGSVSRSVGLLVDVNPSTTTAKYENGVLTLVLPKLVNSGSTRVKVE